MKLHEALGYDSGAISFEGFTLTQNEETEVGGGNTKIWHEILVPREPKPHMIDYSPYQKMTEQDLKQIVEFYKIMQRFPTREDIPSNGPISSRDLPGLVQKAFSLRVK